MATKDHEIEYMNSLLKENEGLKGEIQDLSKRMFALKNTRAANFNIVRSIAAKHSISLPLDVVPQAREVPTLLEETGGTFEPEGAGRKYGAQRSKIRAACAKFVEFDLEAIAEACPEIPKAKIANALWNMTKGNKPELRIVRRVGSGGARTTPIYSFIERPSLAAPASQ